MHIVVNLEGDFPDQVFTKANLCATIVSYVNYVVKKLSNKPSKINFYHSARAEAVTERSANCLPSNL
jgi:hypothetical protein